MKHSYAKLYLSLVSAPATVQFTRVMVASLVSAPATRAVYQSVCHIFCACPLAVGQVDFQNVGVCACRRCSSADWLSDSWSLRLPPVQFTRVFAHNVVMIQYMTLQVSSVMLRWVVLTLACPEIVPFALPCCLSYICFGALCAWSNRVCVEFSIVSCFRLPTSFADLVFAMIGH